MAKTIMDMTPQELLKMFVQEVGTLIDVRIKTSETIIKAEIKDAKNELKADIKLVEQKLDKEGEGHKTRLESLDERTERIEKHIGISHPTKN